MTIFRNTGEKTAFGIVDSSGPVITVKVTVELKKSELERIQGVAAETIKRWNKIGILVILENFRGWERKDDWGDMTFAHERRVLNASHE